VLFGTVDHSRLPELSEATRAWFNDELPLGNVIVTSVDVLAAERETEPPPLLDNLTEDIIN
jgi:hypothetical protein